MEKKEQLTDLSCNDFLAVLASKEPVPGGGGAAALGGALGAALTSMVANLTAGKKTYAAYEEEVQTLLDKCQTLRQELLDLVEQDGQVFAPLSQAFRLPAGTEEEKALKKQAVAQAAVGATQVPLAIAEKVYAAMLLARRIGEIGSKLAVSDAGCAILFLHAALGAARYNILINLPMLADVDFADRTRERLQFLLAEGERLRQETMMIVEERL